MNYDQAMDELAKRDISVNVDFINKIISMQQRVGKSFINIELVGDNGRNVEFITWDNDDDFRSKIITQVLEFIEIENEVIIGIDDFEGDYSERYDDFMYGRMGKEL